MSRKIKTKEIKRNIYPRSVVHGTYYLRLLEFDPTKLGEVMVLVPLRDPEERENATERLIEIVSEFSVMLPPEKRTADSGPRAEREPRAISESSTNDPDEPMANIHPSPVAFVDLRTERDLEDLDRLAQLTENLLADLDLNSLSIFLENISDMQDANPVLLKMRVLINLPWQYKINGLAKCVRERDSSMLGEICARWSQEIARVRQEVEEERRLETRCTRRENLPQHRLVLQLYHFWRRYTGKGTSRHNSNGQDSGPFLVFMTAAGRLVIDKFKGKRLAIDVHEYMKDEPSRIASARKFFGVS